MDMILVSILVLSLVVHGESQGVVEPTLYYKFDEEVECDASFVYKFCINPTSNDIKYQLRNENRKFSLLPGINGKGLELKNAQIKTGSFGSDILTCLPDFSCSSLTISFWANFTLLSEAFRFFHTVTVQIHGQSVTFGHQGIAIIWKQEPARGMYFYVQSNTEIYEARIEDSYLSPSVMTWIHIVMTWRENDNITVYLNGENVTSNTKQAESSKIGTLLSVFAFGDQSFTTFIVDEFKFWSNTQLPSENIKQIYDTSRSQTTTPALTATTRPIFVEEAPKQLKNVSEKLFDSQQKTQNRTFTDPVELEEIVEQVIKTTSELTEILEDPETPQQLSTDVAISYMEGAADTTTSLVSSENADTWQMVSDKTTVLNNIIEALDEVKDALIESLIPSEIVEVEIKQRKTLSLAIFPENTKGKSLDVAPSNNVRIGISDEVLTGLADDSPVIVAANVYTGAEECYAEIPSQEVDIFNEIDSPKTTSDNAPFRVLTQIVSVNLRPKLVDGYYVTLKFNHTQEPPRTQNYSIFCGYINKTTNKWTNEKCRVIATNMNSTTIQSDHLTNFAILMQVVDFQVPEFHLQNLSLITYIGSAISIFCLVLALCVFALVKNPTGNPNDNVRGHRTERYHLHANLALAILLGQVTFLVGANYEPKTASCKATAILLHFFYMSAFSWMFVEGLHLYNLVVKVFRSARSRLHYYYIIGWGTPLLICVISVAAAYQGYGEIKNCWLDTENSKVIWAFVGPALVVVVVNILILVKVVRIITNLAKSQENCINCMTDKTTVVVCAKAIAILLPILGVTWVFGVLAVNEDTIVFQYLFAICNSLQGFFLFMFHCVFNSETRTSLKYKTKSFRADLQSRTITSTRSAKKATKVELVKSAEIVSEEPPVGLSDTATTAFNTNNNSNGYATPDRSRASSRTDYFSAPGKKNGYRQWRNDAPGTPTGRLSASSRKIDPNVGQAW